MLGPKKSLVPSQYSELMVLEGFPVVAVPVVDAAVVDAVIARIVVFARVAAVHAGAGV
jgi:hypothetical protein